MQLLEKDPDKRPASATDVLNATETIDLVDTRAPTEEVATIARGPLYQRTFVGRETELKQLQSAFDSATSGNGALMMVVGEPGIGKTAICEQLSTFATIRGGKPLVGHCYEEGSLSLPYLAFVEVMCSYVLARETRELRKELGTDAADVARIVSEIREKLKVKPREEGDPEEERYRLVQAVSGFLIAHIGRFYCQYPVFRQTYILSIRTKTQPTGSSKNLVTFFKSLYIFAYCFNFSG